MGKLILVSGLPGSGKTTWAYQKRNELEKEGYSFYEDIALHSADEYFEEYNENGDLVYNFDPKGLKEAHNQCFFNTLVSMREDKMLYIIVHNTFTQNWEISPYIALANAFGYEHEIVRLICDPTHGKENNIHNVPDKTIDSMYARMEKPLPFWNYTTKVVDWK